MSTLSLRLPESLHRRLSELAQQDGTSINQLISTAVAEKVSALLTEDYLAARAQRGSRARFEAVLSRVPDAEPVQGDDLPRAAQQGVAAGAAGKPRRRAARGGARSRRRG